jgi:hypothetical protein
MSHAMGTNTHSMGFAISVGGNVLHINSTKDGRDKFETADSVRSPHGLAHLHTSYSPRLKCSLCIGNYTVYIQRAAPAVTNIEARATGAYGSQTPTTGLRPFTPLFSASAGPAASVYVFNVSYRYTWAEFRPTFTSGNVSIDNGPTCGGQAVATGMWQWGFWLKPGAWNTFHVCSSMDGNYTIKSENRKKKIIIEKLLERKQYGDFLLLLLLLLLITSLFFFLLLLA